MSLKLRGRKVVPNVNGCTLFGSGNLIIAFVEVGDSGEFFKGEPRLALFTLVLAFHVAFGDNTDFGDFGDFVGVSDIVFVFFTRGEGVFGISIIVANPAFEIGVSGGAS